MLSVDTPSELTFLSLKLTFLSLASHPFRTVGLPLSDSGNPGVNGVSHRGCAPWLRLRFAVPSACAPCDVSERASERASERFRHPPPCQKGHAYCREGRLFTRTLPCKDTLCAHGEYLTGRGCAISPFGGRRVGFHRLACACVRTPLPVRYPPCGADDVPYHGGAVCAYAPSL